MLLLVGLIASSCTTNAPKPPRIKLYLHYAPLQKALCSDSETGTCKAVDIANTDKWFMLPPSEYQKLQDYIDLLSCVIDNACQNFSPTYDDARKAIEAVKGKTNQMKSNLLRQRR